jgi:hypothetical protein
MVEQFIIVKPISAVGQASILIVRIGILTHHTGFLPTNIDHKMIPSHNDGDGGSLEFIRLNRGRNGKTSYCR